MYTTYMTFCEKDRMFIGNKGKEPAQALDPATYTTFNAFSSNGLGHCMIFVTILCLG